MKRQRETEIMGCTLFLTCSAFPEQYDVIKYGRTIGYLRLRHGWFYASIMGLDEEIVYEADPKGQGEFDDDEREHYLTKAVEAVLRYQIDGAAE